MDRVERYRAIVRALLTERSQIPYGQREVHDETVFDHEADRYLIVAVGWVREQRVHGCLVHIDIIDGKLWVQQDGTEDGVTNDLVAAGIPKEHIVLAFHPVEVRPHTGYAVA